MEKYTIYCTAEQTKKAIELGAPIKVYAVEYDNSNRKDNEFYIMNDVVFTYGVDVCYNECGELVYVTGEIYKRCAYYIPTAEQMIGWLRKEKGLYVEPYLNGECRYSFSPIVSTKEDGEIIHCDAEDSPEEATLAAIDAALDYLSKTEEE